MRENSVQKENRWSTSVAPGILLLVFVLFTVISLSAANSGRMVMSLYSGDYDIFREPDGFRIQVDDFSQLMDPGKPLLPLKRFQILLPPGARAVSVDVIGSSSVELPLHYDLEPFAGLLPLLNPPYLEGELARLAEEWQANNEAVYLSDQPYPASIAWLSGAGTLRKYSYVSVAFCPFTYHPVSGRLVYQEGVEVAIDYTLPSSGSFEAEYTEQIRNFLREYYIQWGIEYVLFVGDYATIPMRICYPDPSYHVYDPSDPGIIAGGTPSDYYYADLSYPDSLSWDLDGDGFIGEYNQDLPDFLAEVYVGRIPVNDTSRISYTLNKSVAFEQDNGSWKKNALHPACMFFFENQNHGGYPNDVDGATIIDSIENGLMAGWNITHMSEQWGLTQSQFSWQGVSEVAFSNYWRNGEYSVVNWAGHGWTNQAARWYNELYV